MLSVLAKYDFYQMCHVQYCFVSGNLEMEQARQTYEEQNLCCSFGHKVHEITIQGLPGVLSTTQITHGVNITVHNRGHFNFDYLWDYLILLFEPLSNL